MGAGILGGIGGQISDMRYRGPEEFPGFIDDMETKTLPDVEMPSPPGYQMPSPGMPDPKPPSNDKQGNEQYFLQMRQSIESLNEAMKQLQGMQTPGGQYNSDMGMMSPGGNYDSGAK